MNKAMYDSMKATVKELDKYSRATTEKAKHDAFWNAYYMSRAYEYAMVAVEKKDKPLDARDIPWDNDAKYTVAWCETVHENGIDKLKLDLNQSSAFGRQISAMMKAGYYITGTSDEYLILEYRGV